MEKKINLTEAMAIYRRLVRDKGRKAANNWLFSDSELVITLRNASPLDLIVESINDNGELVGLNNKPINI